MKYFYFGVLLICFASFAQGQPCYPSADCQGAPLFCGYALQSFPFDNSITGNTLVEPQCGWTSQNSNWFRIIPCSSTLSLTIWVSTSVNNNGLQVALYSACQTSATIACSPGQAGGAFLPLQLTAMVEPGVEYLLQIDGYDGDICNYGIQVNSGLDIAPPSPPMATVNGTINASSSTFCNGPGGSVATFTANWPGCAAFDNPLNCFTPPADSCYGLKWILPPGAVVVGNPYANPIVVNFQHVLADNYTIRARPMECGCADDLCTDCGQACCPAAELFFQLYVSGSCNQDCADFEYPAPPGDECSAAPFLCGNYLDGYCSSNAGLGNDTLAGTVLHNSGFIRLSPCEDFIHLRLQARDCAQGNDLTFRLMSGTCEDPEFVGSMVVPNGVVTDFIFPISAPYDTYFLVFDGGPSGNICEFSIEVEGGIGTEGPGGTFSCECTGGNIVGPTELCPTDIAIYSLTPRVCDFTFTPGGGGYSLGNGYSCCPDTSTLDSIRVVWHIPDAMNFLSDSVNVNSITVQVDSGLLGIDTMITGLIWVGFEPVFPDNIPGDSLVYCDCPTMNCPLDGGGSLTVHISHEVERQTCRLTCVQQTCYFETFEGGFFAFNQAGSYTEQTNCKTYIFDVFDFRYPPPLTIPSVPPLNCSNPVRTLVAQPYSTAASFSWIGPGIISSPNVASISVNVPGTYSCVIIDDYTGCPNIFSRYVAGDFTPPVAESSPNIDICQGEAITLSAAGSSTGGNFTYTWSTGQAGQDISVSPASTSVYTLTVRNTTNGCVSTASTTVTVNPPDTLDHGVVGTISCLETCVQFLGNEYCAPGTYLVQTDPCLVQRFEIIEDDLLPMTHLVVNICSGECYSPTGSGLSYCQSGSYSFEFECVLFVLHLTVNEVDTLDLGVVGSITCAQPCVNFQGVDYCASGVYTIETAYCEISRFIIVEDQSLPTVTLPVVTLCEGQCYSFYGQDYCATTTVSQEDNCTNFIQEIIVNAPDTLELGTVGQITCQQPCVNYQGMDYCAPGIYTLQLSPCEIGRFTIGEDLSLPTVTLPLVTLCEGQCYSFYGQDYCTTTTVSQEDNCTNFIQEIIVHAADTLELGIVGQITCIQPCVNYEGTDYCAAGTYTLQLSPCEIGRFIIEEDLFLPTVTLPVVTLCEGQCYSFYGQDYCTTTTVSQEDNCTNFIQEIIVNAPDTIELGIVGQITCQQPCVDYQGTDYCAAGTYTLQLSPCEIGQLTIGADPLVPSVTLPVVTLCEGQCYSFYGQDYCATTTVSQQDNCTIFVQEIIVNTPTVVQAGLVGNLSCGATCLDYLGNTYCSPGQYVDTTACLLTFFEIGFVKDTQQLGQIGTLSCQQLCVSFMQDLYCAPGDYSLEDDCTVFYFSIGENLAAPGYNNPNLHCLPNNQQYTVNFVITGTPPYKVNGENISGSYFVSNPYANGAPYAFVIEQVSNGCQTVVSGSHDCSFMCTGNPGSMLAERIEVCIGSEVQVVPAIPPQPAAGQVVRFLLHTLPGTTPGTILAENSDGVFTFDPVTMAPEETYYLSCAIGTLTSAGVLDFSNLCTRMASGQPVVFHELPQFTTVLPVNPSCPQATDGSLNVWAEGAEPLSYALNGGLFNNQTSFDGLGSGAYDLTVRDLDGCQADTAIVLVAPDTLLLSLGPDREVIRGETILLQPQTNVSTPNFTWSNNQNSDTHDGPDWLVQPASATLYHCIAQDANGCAANASVLVKVKSGRMYYPNVLSQSSQEPANRNFTLFAREGYIQQIKSLKIFDRWGGLAFQRDGFAPNQPELGWDGAIGGQPANPAVFVFVAEVLLFDGTVEVVKGDVTVL